MKLKNFGILFVISLVLGIIGIAYQEQNSGIFTFQKTVPMLLTDQQKFTQLLILYYIFPLFQIITILYGAFNIIYENRREDKENYWMKKETILTAIGALIILGTLFNIVQAIFVTVVPIAVISVPLITIKRKLFANA